MLTIFSLITVCIVTGGFWYLVFMRREKRLLDRLQNMVDDGAAGNMQRTEISETKFSALENSLKKFLNDSQSSLEDRRRQKEIIQGLISDIAHQTLTPISNVKLYAELLKEQTGEPSAEIDTICEQTEKLDFLILGATQQLGETTGCEQTEKLDFLIQSLVKLSRMENGIISVHPKETSIEQLFDALRREFSAKAKEKQISLEIVPSSLSAAFDLRWTREAVGNILDNAIKYTGIGGQIRISSEKYSFFTRLDIADNGIGIAEEEVNLIFSRFYRSIDAANEPGTGIGLYLSREILRAQKGYIKVRSRKGTGSVFSVFLPNISEL